MAGSLEQIHQPVLVDLTTDLMVVPLREAAAAGRTPVAVDGTLGIGGHAEALLAAVPTAVVIGIDRDQEALVLASQRLARYRSRLRLAHDTFDALPAVLAAQRIARVDAILLDLGVSSLQLDRPERGFAYSRDTPLDMRMDARTGATAADVVNNYPVKELTHVFRTYGEERFARRIAEAIAAERAQGPISSSARLAELVRQAIPAPARRSGGHPAKRVFQALRIEVNDELGALQRVLPAALAALGPGGRLVVMSYHSLEDRMVKQAFAAATSSSAPADLPEVPEHLQAQFRAVTRGAHKASAVEISANPRATSVRLRAIERIREAA